MASWRRGGREAKRQAEVPSRLLLAPGRARGSVGGDAAGSYSGLGGGAVDFEVDGLSLLLASDLCMRIF